MADLSLEGPSVSFSVPLLDHLFEAGPLLRRLQQICRGRCDLEVIEDSSAALLEASKYYEKLDRLESRLGVLRLEVLDIEDGIAVRKLRRELVAEEDSINITSPLLDTITVEAHEIEKMANVLGFTGSLGADISSATTEEDICCFFADGVWAHGDGKEAAELEGMPVIDCMVDKGEEVFYVGNSKTPLDPEVKEMMKLKLLWKIERLRQILLKTKRGGFCLQSMNCDK